MCLALTEHIAYVISFKSSQQSTSILILQVRKLSHRHRNHTPRSGGRGGPNLDSLTSEPVLSLAPSQRCPHQHLQAGKLAV